MNCSSKLHVCCCCDGEGDSEERGDPAFIEFCRAATAAAADGGNVCEGAGMGGGTEAAALMGGRNAVAGCGKGNGSGNEKAGGGTMADGVVTACSRGL